MACLTSFEEFFGLPDCCLGDDFDLKIYNYFVGSAVAFRTHPDIRSALKGWILGYHFTDMVMERLLGYIRHWCLLDHADAERLISSAMLGQVVQVMQRSD